MHASRCVIALMPVALSVSGLGGCDKLSSTTVRTLEDGTRNEKSWVRTWKDRARFECVASTSGACQVVVFVSECPGAACKTTWCWRFRHKPVGPSSPDQLPRGFKYCLSHTRRPVAPACLNV